MSADDRHSKAAEVLLISDPEEIAIRESENAIAQFDMVLDLIDEVVRGDRPFRLRPSKVLGLHRIALDGLSRYAGTWRTTDIEIEKSNHEPPPAHMVAIQMEEMCDYVEENFDSKPGLHLCAYVMWRLNWIHPFTDGNGRTSRAAAYFVLSAKEGFVLPGQNTIPEQIAADKTPYYDALEAADKNWAADKLDLSALEGLLKDCLAKQLLQVLEDASNVDGNNAKDRKFH
jgi:Fic family protein